MKYLIAALITVFLNSCIFGAAPLVATGAAAGYVASQDRSTGRVVDDTAAWSKLKSKLADDPAKRFTRLHVKVNEGRALLLGHVHNREAKKDAVQIAWSVEGIKEVINDIEISHHERATVVDFARDTLITTQVKAKLAAAEHLTSRNFSIDTHDGKVYIMGIADSKAELDRAVSIARAVRHVKKVICHARVKSAHEKYDHRQ